MSTEPDFVLAPGAVEAHISLEPVHNALTSLYCLTLVERFAGMDEWVELTAAALPHELARANHLLFEALSEACEPEESYPDFPAYLNALAQQDAFEMRERVLKDLYLRTGDKPAQPAFLENREAFLERMQRRYPDQEIDRQLFGEAHALLANPPSMQSYILAHMQRMWFEILSSEWERRKPMLEQVLQAFHARKYTNMSAYEAIQEITGRDMRGNWQWALARARQLIFIPSAHVGPYLVKFVAGSRMRITFGARLPRGARTIHPELSHADLLLRLRALADETRLNILRLIAERDELCAQEIIAILGLSQSSASRHLSQLSASGYLVERQGEGKAKCYRLNPALFQETMSAIGRFIGID